MSSPFSEQREKERLSQREQEVLRRIEERPQILGTLHEIIRKQGYPEGVVDPRSIVEFVTQFSEKDVAQAIRQETFSDLLNISDISLISFRFIASNSKPSAEGNMEMQENFISPLDMKDHPELLFALFMSKREYARRRRGDALKRLRELYVQATGEKKIHPFVIRTLQLVGKMIYRDPEGDSLTEAWEERTHKKDKKFGQTHSAFTVATQTNEQYRKNVAEAMSATVETGNDNSLKKEKMMLLQLAAYIKGLLTSSACRNERGVMGYDLSDPVRLDVVIGGSLCRVELSKDILPRVDLIYQRLSEQLQDNKRVKKYDQSALLHQGYAGKPSKHPEREPHFIVSLDQYDNLDQVGHANHQNFRENLPIPTVATHAHMQLQVVNGVVSATRIRLTHRDQNGMPAVALGDEIHYAAQVEVYSQLDQAQNESSLLRPDDTNAPSLMLPAVEKDRSLGNPIEHAFEVVDRISFSRKESEDDQHDLWSVDPALQSFLKMNYGISLTPTLLMHMAMMLASPGRAVHDIRASGIGTLWPLVGATKRVQINLKKSGEFYSLNDGRESKFEKYQFIETDLSQIVRILLQLSKEKQNGPMVLWLAKMAGVLENPLQKAAIPWDRKAVQLVTRAKRMISQFTYGRSSEYVGRRNELIALQLLPYIDTAAGEERMELARYYANELVKRRDMLAILFRVASVFLHPTQTSALNLFHDQSVDQRSIVLFRERLRRAKKTGNSAATDLFNIFHLHNGDDKVSSNKKSGALHLNVNSETLLHIVEIIYGERAKLGDIDVTTANASSYDSGSDVNSVQVKPHEIVINGRISSKQMQQPETVDFVGRSLLKKRADLDKGKSNEEKSRVVDKCMNLLKAYFSACADCENPDSRQRDADEALRKLYVFIFPDKKPTPSDLQRFLDGDILGAVCQRWRQDMEAVMENYRLLHKGMRGTSLDDWKTAFNEVETENARQLGKKQRKEQG